MSRSSGRNPKSPAYQWYPTDALTDARYAELTYEERGVFHALLDYAWLNDGLPTEPERLARLLRLSQADFDRVWVSVSRCFRPRVGDPSRLVNGRQEREREAQAEYSAKMRDNAAKTNATRTPRDTPRVTPRDAPGDTHEARHAGAPESLVPTGVTKGNSSRSVRAREDSPPASGDPPMGEHTALCAWWVERYRLATTSPVSPQGARYEMSSTEGAKVRELLTRARANGRGADLVREVVERFIAHKVFGQEPPTLGRVLANWNTLVAVPAAQAPPSRPAPEPPDASDVRNAWERRHRRKIPDPHGRPGLVEVVDPYPGYAAAKAELEKAHSATGAA